MSQVDFEERIIKLQDGEHIFVKRCLPDWDSRKDEQNIISSTNLTFDSGLLTLKHAKLSYENGVFSLEDLKSRNSTYIGSTELKPYQSHKVESQELINFGGLVTRIEITPLSEEVNSNLSKKHECHVCKRQFSQFTNMQLHLNVHKDDPKVEIIKAGWEEKNSKVFKKSGKKISTLCY